MDTRSGSPVGAQRVRPSFSKEGFTMLNMSKTLWVLAVLGAVTGGRAEPIRAHPDNPHFYLFRSRPTVLITSAEHYGAVIKPAFLYNAYLDGLKSFWLDLQHN